MKVDVTQIIPGQPTANDRIYSKDIMRKAIDEYNSKPLQHRMGEIANRQEDVRTVISLHNVSHIVEHVDMTVEGVITAEIKILDTPSGKILKEQIENFTTNWRMFGNIGEDKQTITDMNIIALDFISK